MSEEQTVTYELEGEIALVGLNRPDKRNCFNPTVMKQLRDAIERAGEEPTGRGGGCDLRAPSSVRGLVTSGRGGHHRFS